MTDETKPTGRERLWNRGDVLRVACAIGSALMLAAAFPPLEWADAAWIALVPLLLAVRFSPPRVATRLGFLCGVVFWMLSIAWLTRVTVPGWFCLCAYCALFVALFARVVGGWMRRLGTERSGTNLLLLAGVPLAWTGIEYARATLFTGCPWNPLGVSQHANLPIIQIARWGGVPAVSALVVAVNTGVALTILRYMNMFRERRRRLENTLRGMLGGSQPEGPGTAPSTGPIVRIHVELLLPLLLLAAALSCGFRHILRDRALGGRQFQVVAVQPNIPQEDKWTPELARHIHQRLRTLTETAILGHRVLCGNLPDLIVWPETSLPDFVRSNEDSTALVQGLLAQGAPLLVGSLDLDDSQMRIRYYNSSILFTPGTKAIQKYDKQHLLIFGEYVPLEGVLPFLRALTPIEGSISPGTQATVLRVGDVLLSVLICFEDAVPQISRRFVRKGARLLVNQTNDAWFDVSSASRQHMCHCVFRCVENGVPAVRVANTGVTCFIERDGRVHDIIAGPAGNVQISDWTAASVTLPPLAYTPTFYTMKGDVFAMASIVVLILAAPFAFFGLTGVKLVR